MDDRLPTTGEESDLTYTETIVDYVDNRRQRVVLAGLLIILFLLLLGASYAVIRLTPGKGAPQAEGDLPSGITWVRSIYGWGNSPDQALVAPTDVAIGDNGVIWAVSGHDTIAAFNPDGTSKIVFKPENTVSLEGIAVGDDGNIYVADFGGQVIEFAPDGSLIDQWKVQLAQEVDVRGGKIAVSASNGIAVFTPDGEMVFQVGGARGWEDDQFDLPHGIVLTDDGSVFVSDTQNRRLKALDPTGRNLWMLGEAPNRTQEGVADVRSQDSSISASPFLLPAGMTVDGKGRLVVVDPFKFRITVVDPKSGEIVRESRSDGSAGQQAVYGDYGQADGYFAYPTGIDYDKTRDWFAVADTYNNRIQIVRLPDTGGTIVAPIIGGFRLPMCIFCLPLALLLVALAIAVKRSRASRAQTVGEMSTPGV